MALPNITRLPWREKPRDQTDLELLKAVASGDEKALESLFRRYFRKLIGFAARITGRIDIAEEVATDTLMAVWHGAKNYEGRSRPSTWIFGIAYRIALKARSRNSRIERLVDAEAAMDNVPDERAGHTLETLFLRRDLSRALSVLSPEQRAVIQLTYYYGYTYSEIAEIMGCPVGTVKSRMSHARAKLNELLVDFSSKTEEDHDV